MSLDRRRPRNHRATETSARLRSATSRRTSTTAAFRETVKAHRNVKSDVLRGETRARRRVRVQEDETLRRGVSSGSTLRRRRSGSSSTAEASPTASRKKTSSVATRLAQIVFRTRREPRRIAGQSSRGSSETLNDRAGHQTTQSAEQQVFDLLDHVGLGPELLHAFPTPALWRPVTARRYRRRARAGAGLPRPRRAQRAASTCSGVPGPDRRPARRSPS